MYSKEEVIKLLRETEKHVFSIIENERGRHNNTPEIDDAFIKAMKGSIQLYREDVEVFIAFDCKMSFKKKTN